MNAGNIMGDIEPMKPVRHNPTEQFILLAKGTRGAACCDLIKTVLEAPGVYVFAELLELTNVKDLESTPNAKFLHTLNLFAYGTFKDYVTNRDKLIDLTDVMVKKLKHLTIVTMAIGQKCIAYEDLQQQLEIEHVRDLEDLIIESIYADIIHGKLDQRKKQLEVDYTIGRDIKQEDIVKIADTLKDWCNSCETMLNTIELQIEKANTAKTTFNQHNDEIEKEMAKLKKTLKLHAPERDEEMVIDYKESASSHPIESRRKTKSKIMKASSATGGTTSVRLHR